MPHAKRLYTYIYTGVALGGKKRRGGKDERIVARIGSEEFDEAEKLR